MPTAAQQQYSGSTRVDPLYSPERAKIINVNLIASTTFAKGTILGELTATPGTFAAYASGNSDGTQVAKGILQYACVTDASKNITIVGEFTQTQKGAPMYVGGFFKIADLTGLDAAGLANMGGHIVNGIITAGTIYF